jgi:integrase
MPRRATERLTDKLVRALPVPGKGATITYDADVPGFGARVTANGTTAFVLNYMSAGRERRMTIGRFPTWSATAAREEARALRRKVDAGIDPMVEREALEATAAAERSAPTMADLFSRYESEHLPRKSPRAAADDRSMWHKIVLPRLGAMKVAAVRHDDIDALHAEVSKTRPVRANRIVEVVRKAFNLAIRWGWRADNPASGVHCNHEEKRARYLSGAELMKLSEALAAHPSQNAVNAVRLLLLTGARRGEVLSATWDQFDLDAGVWTKPSAHTKQKQEHRVPISAPARQLLVEMKTAAEERAREKKHELSPYLFPARIGDGPMVEIKTAWATLCKAAKLNGVRLHDIRHTYASVLASAGLSLPVIGALLGHTQPGTTARYAHLFDDPLRAATERVGAVVAGAARDAAEIMPMRKGG